MAGAGAVLLIGLSFIDVMDVLIDEQFVRAMRQDVTVTFAEPLSADAVHAVGRLPGVVDVEPMRVVPARLRVGARHRTLAVTGLVAEPRLNRIVDRAGRVWTLPPDGLVLSRMLGTILGVGAGDTVRVEVLEGARPAVDVAVAALVDDSMGLQAYMHVAALRRLMREGGTVSGAALLVDPAALDTLNAELKHVPAVAGVAVRDATLRAFRQTMAEHMNVIIFINVFFSGIIAFGVVYNAARVSLSERSRELASLRVLGFTRAEVALILLGELALLTLASLPVGLAMGYGLGLFIMTIFTNEVYRLPFVVTPQTMAWTSLTVIGAALLSSLAVRRQLDHLDLVAVLKSRSSVMWGLLRNRRVWQGTLLVGALLAVALWPRAVTVEAGRVARDRLTITIDEDGETRVHHRFVVSARSRAASSVSRSSPATSSAARRPSSPASGPRRRSCSTPAPESRPRPPPTPREASSAGPRRGAAGSRARPRHHRTGPQRDLFEPD